MIANSAIEPMDKRAAREIVFDFINVPQKPGNAGVSVNILWHVTVNSQLRSQTGGSP